MTICDHCHARSSKTDDWWLSSTRPGHGLCPNCAESVLSPASMFSTWADVQAWLDGDDSSEAKALAWFQSTFEEVTS